MESIQTIIEKTIAIRKAQEELDDAIFEFRRLPIERILKPYLGKRLRITLNCGRGQVEYVEGKLIYVNELTFIQLEDPIWNGVLPSEHQKYVILDVKNFDNIEVI